jgi:hypothetical protein
MEALDPYTVIEAVMNHNVSFGEKRVYQPSQFLKVNYVAVLAYGRRSCKVIGKRPRRDNSANIQGMIEQLENGDITQAVIKKRLEEAVNVQSSIEEEDHASKSKKNVGLPLYMTPFFDMDNAGNDIEHPLFTFRPIPSHSTGLSLKCVGGDGHTVLVAVQSFVHGAIDADAVVS